ncbi:hypothetical protein [Magnetovibrio blakemorei]|uniref:Uncharacterized protein n=1 Tax=Magnetovibrio blakemorei TaxID=28181 RepID=A0A1E5Q7T7_9PROT|nr:hypothetical protein [Magnetovibrio blakemorei]OEJ67102.1 hypothetical protein BEN30_10000 [Magnetovibrio blakemorei]
MMRLVSLAGAFRALVVVGSVLALSSCIDAAAKRTTHWDEYYARTNTPRAHVQVVPPEGTTLPMAELIAEYVVSHLQREKISAAVGDGKASDGQYFILTGLAEENLTDPHIRYHHVLRWVLTNANGQVISTYSHGVEGTDQEWQFGDPRLLSAIGFGTAGPIAKMILAETKATVPIDPLRRGLLVEQVSGLNDENSAHLTRAVADALRTSDVFVTGDPRQASFRLAGHVDVARADDGFDDISIVWRVLTMDGRELGNAVQENRLPWGAVEGRWTELAPSVAKAAAVGVEHVFGTRAGPPPGAPERARGEPPRIVLPGEPGRAPPPPQ